MTSFRRRRCVVVVDVVVAKTLTSLQRRDDDGVSVSVVVLTSKSQGCSLGLEFLGLETVSRRFFRTSRSRLLTSRLQLHRTSKFISSN